jgi:hypothetical protein
MRNVNNEEILEGYMFLCTPDEKNAILQQKESEKMEELLRMEDDGGVALAGQSTEQISLYDKVKNQIKSMFS